MAVEIIADRGTQKSNLTFGREALAEKDTSLAVESIGPECVASGILEVPALAQETATDHGIPKSHFALCREALAEGY